MSDEGKGPGASADTCALAEVAFQLTVPRRNPCDLSQRRSNALRGVLLGFVLALVAVALGLGRQGRRRASSVDELLQGGLHGTPERATPAFIYTHSHTHIVGS